MKLCNIENCYSEAIVGDLCDDHSEASAKVKEMFPIWQKAYGRGLTWKKFLYELVENHSGKVGSHCQEIALKMLANIE